MIKVITYGSFDLFHQGHYNLLKRAKALGDYLIVGVTTEQYDISRGKMNVVDSLITRIDNVRKTGFVDEIIVEDHEGQKLEDIQKYNIDIFTLGSDWKGKFDYLNSLCKVIYLERTRDISSTMLRETRFPIVQIGMIGTGRIASLFVEEAKYVSGLNIVGAYNPKADLAQAFSRKYDFKIGTNQLDFFLDSVDAVYIASPNVTHNGYIQKALSCGKHVLCENPMFLSEKEAEDAFELAKSKKLVLMEALKTAYTPGFTKLSAMLRSGRIGEIRDINACITSLTLGTLRKFEAKHFDGSMTELGSYPLFAILRLLGTEYTDVSFKSFVDLQGIDMYTEISLTFQNAVATARAGLGVKSEGVLTVAGTAGYLKVEAPWWKPQTFSLNCENPEQSEMFYEKYMGAGLRYEINAFVNTINDRNKAAEYYMKAVESIKAAQIMERYINREKLTILPY